MQLTEGPTHGRGVLGEQRGEGRLSKRKLSNREREVIERLRVGKSYKIIGYELRIKPSTASVLGWRALRKLGLKDVMELRYRALVEGEAKT